MSRFAAEGEPGTDALGGMSKLVFLTSLREPLFWANTQLVARDAIEVVREMKGKRVPVATEFCGRRVRGTRPSL